MCISVLLYFWQVRPQMEKRMKEQVSMITCHPVEDGLAVARVTLPVAHVDLDRLDEVQSYLSEHLREQDMCEFSCKCTPVNGGAECTFSLMINPNAQKNAFEQLSHLCTSLSLIGKVGISTAGLRYYH